MKKFLAAANADISERERRNQERSRRIAAQGMVLLSNNGALPLKEAGRIALYGNGARKTVKGGTGSGDVNSRTVVTIEQGLEDAGFTVATKEWLDKYDRQVAAEEEARQQGILQSGGSALQALIMAFLAAREPEVSLIEEEDLARDCTRALYVIARNSGEGKDRKVEPGDFLLQEQEEKNLRVLTEFYQTVIVILNVGGVIDTRYIRSLPGIDAVLLMSQAGCMGGAALTDVLTGRVTPSGHLATTWAEKYEDYPAAGTFGRMNGNVDDEYYTEGIYVGYRYFDSFNVTPAYPFGYGLSYTDFDVHTTGIDYREGQVRLTVKVTNTGREYSGKEVVQAYYSAPAGTLEKPYQELAAFAKTRELAPGASQLLSLCIPMERMACYSEEKAAYLLEAGDYKIRVGVNSRDTHIAGILRLSREVVTERLSNRLTPDCELEQLSARGRSPYTYDGEEQEQAAVPVIEIPPASISCKTALYRAKNQPLARVETEEKITVDDVRSGIHTLEELVGQLSVEELADLCVGTARGGVKSESMIGMASTVCPGAAGDTSAQLSQERNIRNMVLADGPAGLRLTQEFMADADGNLILSTAGIGFVDIEQMFGGGQAPELPADAVSYYQYCTAIPIATLLSQSWDLELLEEAGRIVGEEMKEFGITLWLAPGMNIHRNPLCGRNFEYYSEDPYLTGCCAAAETAGVQHFPGIGTTIKHFALNNQEDNRGHVNAHASERAIREIYLKGFEIAIKKARPLALMTSYNLINGIHAANQYDLITAIARDEWGFQGLVMTDWGTTGDVEEEAKKAKYTCSSAAGCIRAGNDLIMPGSQRDVDEIVASVGADAGAVPCPIALGDLQACAKHILGVLIKSASYGVCGELEREVR